MQKNESVLSAKHEMRNLAYKQIKTSNCFETSGKT